MESLMPPQSNQYLPAWLLPLSIQLYTITNSYSAYLHTTSMRLEIPQGAPPWLCLGRTTNAAAGPSHVCQRLATGWVFLHPTIGDTYIFSTALPTQTKVGR